MKIIFCDIDNVLNSDYRTMKNGDVRSEIEERKVKNLKKIVDATGAEVVIVSHANSFMDSSFTKNRIDLIKQYGVNPICDLPCALFDSKADAVLRWLNDNPADSFVVIDDGYDNYDTLLDHLVLVEGRHGLTNKHVKKAIEILNK